MTNVYTVDASVFLNGYNEAEVGSAQSRAFLASMRAETAALFEPTILLVEVAASLARGRGDARLAYLFAMEITQLPELTLVPLDQSLAVQAARLAADLRPRVSDVVYGAVARRFNAVLVTRDREQRERLAAVLTVRSPEEALAELTGLSRLTRPTPRRGSA